MRCVAIAGVPASGKTTLVRQVLGQYSGLRCDCHPLEDEKLVWIAGLVRYHLIRHCQGGPLAVLGDYTPGPIFSGSDRLSMAVQPQAIEFLAVMAAGTWRHTTVLWEGDRLTNRSFLEAVGAFSQLRLVILEATSAELEARQAARGNKQSVRFLAGRRTKVEGLRSMPHVTLQSGPAALDGLLGYLKHFP